MIPDDTARQEEIDTLKEENEKLREASLSQWKNDTQQKSEMTKNEKMFKVGAVLLEVSEYQNTKLLLCVRVYYYYAYL